MAVLPKPVTKSSLYPVALVSSTHLARDRQAQSTVFETRCCPGHQKTPRVVGPGYSAVALVLPRLADA